MSPLSLCLKTAGRLWPLAVLSASAALSAAPASGVLPWPGARPGAALSAGDGALLDQIERAGFRYFSEQADPRTGLVKDRARADGTPGDEKASIAASGFALDAWVIATERGWVARPAAIARVRAMLRFLADGAPRQHGFFYHFMIMDTGARAWNCEVSPIDTSLFLAGAVVAREYFHDPEITRLVDQIYGGIDWRWFLNGGQTLAMAWTDEGGFSRYHWSSYSEHMVMSLLGMGAPDHALGADYWRDWRREPTGTYDGYHYLQGAPLFIHQYSQAYVDFRGTRDAYADYFRNSVLATRAQRRFCLDLHDEFPAWNAWQWGLSASDSANGYTAWGGPPRTLRDGALDGSVVPCAAAGSVPFAPRETLAVLRHLRTVQGGRIWKRYGFVDAFNPETGWVDADVIGIDTGISMIQAENARTGLIWALFMQAPEIQRALRAAEFVSTRRALSPVESAGLLRLAGSAWASLKDTAMAPDNAGLRLTAVAAARALGLVDGADAAARLRTLLQAPAAPEDVGALAEYAAGLVTVRQAVPALAAEATRRLQGIDWTEVKPGSSQLGAASRLAVFFQIAAQAKPGSAWTELARVPERVGPVWVLAPTPVAGQFLPGLWLDERAVISGASASQLAYALAVAPPAERAPDALATALLLDRFPAQTAGRLMAAPPPDGWLAPASSADRAALLITLANVLVPDCVRDWFQADPLVQAGRAAIPEFAAAAFGPKDSLFQRHELAGPRPGFAIRQAVAAAAGAPRGKWDWQVMDSARMPNDAGDDPRPGDPPLTMRFAFTWDAAALHFHAEVMDTPAGYATPAERAESVELFVNPRNAPLTWAGRGDFQFYYAPGKESMEWFHHLSAEGKVRRTAHGYTVEADIPWTRLGVQPRPGLELGVSPAVGVYGRHDWEPATKLNWSYHPDEDGAIALGVLRLE